MVSKNDGYSFFKNLSSIRKGFNWKISDDKKIVAEMNGVIYNPITAYVYSTTGRKKYGNNKKETIKAAKDLGLSRSFAESVYDATISSSNRGHTQVLRGKIRSALKV
jgi:hypothetical protein